MFASGLGSHDEPSRNLAARSSPDMPQYIMKAKSQMLFRSEPIQSGMEWKHVTRSRRLFNNPMHTNSRRSSKGVHLSQAQSDMLAVHPNNLPMVRLAFSTNGRFTPRGLRSPRALVPRATRPQLPYSGASSAKAPGSHDSSHHAKNILEKDLNPKKRCQEPRPTQRQIYIATLRCIY